MLVDPSMICQPVILCSTIPILEVQRYMVKQGLSYLLVVGENVDLLDLVSQPLVLSCLIQFDDQTRWKNADSLSNLTVGDIMIKSEDIVVLEKEGRIEEGVTMMAEKQIGCLPIAEKDVLVGIITEDGLAFRLAEISSAAEASAQITVGEVLAMSNPSTPCLRDCRCPD